MPSSLHRKHFQSGILAFSLLELLVVIAIMGILAAMTMAIGPGFLRANAMSSSLSQVASAISLSRSEAILSRKQTFFALAPDTAPLDDRSFTSYAILRKEDASGTNFAYVTPWKKLPTGVLFGTNSLPTNSLPYPGPTGSMTAMRVISFVSDGALEEDTHIQKPVLPLQAGTRIAASDGPTYRWQDVTNQIVVERLSGKVKVERTGDK